MDNNKEAFLEEKQEKKKLKKNTNDNTKKKLRIYSYNTRGFDKTKQLLCNETLHADNTIPIICVQENFVLKGNTHIITKALPDFQVFVKPAKKDKLEGRPANGMFIALPKELKLNAKDISPSNDRIQSIILETEDSNIMVVNVYFPPDPKTMNYNHDEKLEEVLATIEYMTEKEQCNNVIIVGDLNTDGKRKNGRVKRVKKFLEDNDLDSAWDTYHVDYTHEFEREDVTYTSILDYIIWNDTLSDKVCAAGVIHPISNMSDHSPIYCDIDTTIIPNENSFLHKEEMRGISLKDMDEDDWTGFSCSLDQELKNILTPNCTNCKDIHCKEKEHIVDIDKYVNNVLEVIDKCIAKFIKRKRKNIPKAKVVPGWSDIVKPFCEDAKFWNAIWISAGKPINTTLHNIMKHSRNKYHYAIRKCKRAAEAILRDKMLTSSIDGNDNIFDKIRKMRNVRTNVPDVIDGDKSPVERFSEVYRNLYNSANDKGETMGLYNEIDTLIHKPAIEDVEMVTEEIIGQAISEIKPNKKDPIFTFNSNCIRHAPISLHRHIANIIKLFLIHGHASDILLVSTIVPLIKDKLGKADSSDNYRSIALSSVILKIFDWTVLILFEEQLNLDSLQFGYQKKCSTNMCTWLVVESINHFSRNGSNVYSCFMDMKKAFDMVKHSILFKKLLEKNIPPVYLRLLLVMYISQTAKVRWKGILSEPFPISNGVKQGAVLSAILFCIYIDDLIKQLRRNRIGCWMKNEFVGVAVYADDIALLSPSLDGLQDMINTCSKYTENHNLTFSTNENPAKSKTKCIAFTSEKLDLKHLNLYGKNLPWVESVKHLGTTLISVKGKCSLDQDVAEKRAKYIVKNNELLQEFHYTHPKTKIWINNIYNTSFYGAPLWDMSSRNFEKLEKTWNVSTRLMLSLHRNTHRYLLEPVSDTIHIVKSLRNRFLKFISNIASGTKNVLRTILKMVRDDTRSVTGKNWRIIRLKTETNESEIDVFKDPYKEIKKEDEWRVGMIKEIIENKWGNLYSGLSFDELEYISSYICRS